MQTYFSSSLITLKFGIRDILGPHIFKFQRWLNVVMLMVLLDDVLPFISVYITVCFSWVLKYTKSKLGLIYTVALSVLRCSQLSIVAHCYSNAKMCVTGYMHQFTLFPKISQIEKGIRNFNKEMLTLNFLWFRVVA